MSGFEIAGVVLGSIPLIIAALEHYAEGIATAKRYWRYKSGLRSLILQINTERGIFMNTLEQLLTGIVRIEHMSDFLANPGSGLWQGEEIDEKLKERLRSSFEIYIENVRGMEVALTKMMVKLALDDDGKPQFTDPGLFKQEYKRLKFSLTKAEYDEQLGSLKSFNQALTRLTKQSLELEPSRSSTKTRSCPNFKALQNYARSLYDTLRMGLQCSCQEHGVKLRLESRNKRVEKEEDMLENTPFRVIFSYAFDTSHANSSLPDWKEVDIRWIAEKEKLIPLSPVTLAMHPSKLCPSPGIKQRVRFNDCGVQVAKQQSTTLTMIKAPSASLSPTTNNIPPKATMEQIHSLCTAITKLKQVEQDLCVGYLLDSLKRKHGLYPTTLPPPNQNPWTAYTLRDVLTKRAKIGRRLMQQDKLRVALDLASSVLQLYKTPWLDEHWGKDDVFFIHRPGATPASIYEHPFVYRKFSTSANSHTPSSQRVVGRVIRNQSLFTLGVLLIELWYGKSIEELQEAPDLNWAGTPGIVWCTAERLVEEEIEFEAGKRYSNAVRRCIRCDFDMKEMSLDNESFQKAVYDGVVAELERTLHEFSGKLD